MAGPFDAQHIYVQWSGKLPGAEQFSCGIRLANTTGVGFNVTPGILDAVTAAVKTFHGSALTQVSARGLLNSVKVNLIDADGHYSEDVTHENIFTDFPGGGSAANTPANQVALAVSLTTAVTRGPAHRGRFYLPLPCLPVGADGRYTTTDVGNVGTAADTFIAGLNAASADFKAAVFSRKVGAPAHRLITGNEVGTVPDTQRRRRRSLVENYQ